MSSWRWIWLCTCSTSSTFPAGCTLHRRSARRRRRRRISQTTAQGGSHEHRPCFFGCQGGLSLPSHRRAPTQTCRKCVWVRVWLSLIHTFMQRQSHLDSGQDVWHARSSLGHFQAEITTVEGPQKKGPKSENFWDIKVTSYPCGYKLSLIC